MLFFATLMFAAALSMIFGKNKNASSSQYQFFHAI
jgi:hypothetical protein